MPVTRSDSKTNLVIYLAAILATLVLVLHGVKMLERLREARSAWQEVQADAGYTMHGLHVLLARFGYGGFIDKYRRYQLHPDASLLPAMAADLQAIGNALRRLDSDHIQGNARQAIEVLGETLSRYSRNILSMQAHAGVGMPADIEPVDDVRTLWALAVLSSSAMHEGDAHILEADAALSDVTTHIYFGLVLVLPVFMVALLLAHQRRKLGDAHAATERARLYLDEMLDATPDALLVVDGDGRIRTVNRAATHLFGYRQDEFPGMKVEQLMPLRYRHGHAALRSSSFSKGHQRPFDVQTDFFVLSKAGDEIPVDISLSHVDEDVGRIALLALRDISEHKAMENQLRDRQAALTTAQAIAHIGSWDWDVQADRINWSDEVYRIFGLTPGVYTPSYSGFMERVHPDDRDRVGAAIDRTLQDGSPYEVRHRVMRPDGSERIVMEKGQLNRDQEGRPLCMVGVVLDVTERELAERELLFDKAIIEGISQPVVVVDQQGVIEDVNPAYCQMSGYQHDELLGRPSNILKSGHHDGGYYQELWDSLAKHRKWQGEIWIRCKDGMIMPRLLSITTICESELQRCRYVGFYSDITTLKASEAKLEKLAHFDQLTGLANRMLFHDRLRAALARARRSSSTIAVLFVDLDGFKRVNDRLGHHAGDLLLVDVAERMKLCVREDDTVARLGGDEFALVLNELDGAAAAGELAGRILEQLQITLAAGDETLRVSASIGIALYPDHGEDEGLLLKRSDQAMYQVKQSGKNAFAFFEPAAECSA